VPDHTANMSALLRDAPVGQLIRWATKGRLYPYPEEVAGFQCPSGYAEGKNVNGTSAEASQVASPNEKEVEEDPIDETALRQAATAADIEAQSTSSSSIAQQLSKAMTRPEMAKVTTRADLEQAYTNATKQESLKSAPSRAIIPEKTSDGVILVDWYTTDDPENPQNWSRNKKLLVVTQIYFYTLAVYIGSAIITPSQPYIEERFQVDAETASMGLSMYVLGYGIGPLIFAPMSEIPSIGRNPPYMVTFGIFLILSIGTAVVDDFSGLIALRFFQGFFGSPCLATGGASIGDIFNLLQLPYFLTGWAAFATAGPALGPIISGFSVPATNWHWSLWEIVWLAAPVYISLMFCLPETSAPNILLRRAQRLRKLTGNNNLRSQSEIDQSKLSVNEVVIDALWRPVQINALDPAVLFTSLYTALMYAIFYSFFEVFPFVYAYGLPKANSPTHGYGLNAGEIGLIFLSITVGVSIAIAIYVVYLKKVFEPEIRTKGVPAPERTLIIAMPFSLLLPVGLFVFGWTANSSPNIHWIVPTIGIVIFTVGIFVRSPPSPSNRNLY
jgi:MFS transporter, DHA1 family, multidrug resistance protein